MTIKKLRSGSSGDVPDLRVVGFHGKPGVDQTPARMPPVLADSKNRHVVILEASPLPGRAGFALTAEISAREISDEVWATTGTRLLPSWSARVGDLVFVIGDREIRHVPKLSEQVVEGEPERVIEFLDWLATGAARSEGLTATRVEGGLVAWTCTPGEALALSRRIAEVVRSEVITCARRNEPRALKSTSFWLSRAAVEDSDMFLAAAGLRHADYRHWEALLEAGVRTGTKASRLAAVDEAARHLSAPTPTRPHSPSMSAAFKSKMAHRAIDSSIGKLFAASPAPQVAA